MLFILILLFGILLFIKSIASSMNDKTLNVNASDFEKSREETYQHIQTTGALFFSLLFIGIGMLGYAISNIIH